MSYICQEEDIPDCKKWLSKDVGVTIFKIVPYNDRKQIIFYVSAEYATLLKLKYPNGTFIDNMS